MNWTIYDLVSQHYRITNFKGEVGIEIEVETKNQLMKLPNGNWRAKADGSLRGNGYEFVTLGPLLIKEKNSEIERICKFIAENDPLIKSPRTSVHVHHNMQDLTAVQVWTYITAYYLLENLLFKFCSPDREGNTFCLRLTDADSCIDGMIRDLQQTCPFSVFRADRYKYLGGSPHPITRFGSFEWRGLEGGSYSPEVIKAWTDIIITLKECSKKFASPALLMDRYFYIGDHIIKELLPSDIISFFTSRKNWTGLIKENAYLIGQLAYAVDWIKYETFINGEAEKVKKNNATMPSDAFLWDRPPQAELRVRQQAQAGVAEPLNHVINIDDFDF